jgi:hypothetical protein
MTGHLKGVTDLRLNQWAYALATGLILLAFTVTAFMALRSATATAAAAIPAAAPIITSLCVAIAARQISLTTLTTAGLTVAGLALMLVALVAIGLLGRRREQQRWQSARQSAEKVAIA